MSRKLRLFEAYGIELEYMIVDRDTLAVKPICDQVIEALSGKIENEISLGKVNISNELVLHVLEYKCNGPQKDLVDIQKSLQEQIPVINKILERWNACLLPTAMHPLMNPDRETKLWPHGQNEIYASYNRIFDCRGHGWSNLQSVHINLPFADDAEFGRLHAAIRVALPLLPAIAGSSPVVEGKVTGKLDNRLDFYMQNQRRIPSIIGSVIPERVFTEKDYQEKILQKIYRDIAPQDPEEILQDEWLNSRGAIARFQRNAIEIRVLDIQETVFADFGVIGLVVSLVKSLVDEGWLTYEEQMEADENEMREVFKGAAEQGLDYELTNPFLLNAFNDGTPASLRDIWNQICERLIQASYPIKDFAPMARRIIQEGNLASRISRNLGKNPDGAAITREYRRLADCLQNGTFYV